jgi:hypothetical protein
LCLIDYPGLSCARQSYCRVTLIRPWSTWPSWRHPLPADLSRAAFARCTHRPAGAGPLGAAEPRASSSHAPDRPGFTRDVLGTRPPNSLSPELLTLGGSPNTIWRRLGKCFEPCFHYARRRGNAPASLTARGRKSDETSLIEDPRRSEAPASIAGSA